MYTNLAYLGKPHQDIVDMSKPILVTACGYYRVHSSSIVETERPNGRGDYQLLYIAEGKAHFYFDKKEITVSKGNMILFRPGESQIYYYYAKEKPESYWVHFTGNAVEQILKECNMPESENIFWGGTSPDYQWLFRQMIQELQLRRVNYEDILRMMLQHVFLMINRYITEEKTTSTEVLNEIERATHYFNDNYNKSISIKDYAAKCHMSECWFINNFKKLTKYTPAQYLVSLRIVNAINLLDNTDYNVTDISVAVGYENPLYFSRLFKKHVGMSPTEYRNSKNKKRGCKKT